ncbi:hypothetical protein RA307_17440 [Xanthobacteraceae bacterium Astr-EGSB]|uniref:hypothetical protein n=1 Tax=Astrobacterium formosum TaxID=3069710 RepID=UPI0027B665E8|nr:hypothetical protein [Xanthobacteraceae bacterium Astr-EGSB]
MANQTSTERRPGGPNAAPGRLRADIDHGRTGDKVDWPDPAAAPLGTDEEAAGTPTPEAAIDAARRQESQGVSHPQQRHVGFGAAWVMFAFILFAGIAAAIWILRSA